MDPETNSIWKTVEGDAGFVDTLTTEYTDKMQKLVTNAIALDTLRKKVNGDSAIVAKARFNKRERKQRNHYKKSKLRSQVHKSTVKVLFRIANRKIQQEIVRQARLKKHLKRHH